MADAKMDEKLVLALALLDLVIQAASRLHWLFERPDAKLSDADKATINKELAKARARLDQALAALPT